MEFEKDPFPPGPPAPLVHLDNWQNPVTGIGTWERDKVEQMIFKRPRYNLTVDWKKLQEMFHYDPLSRRIVETWPQHMFRRGWIMKTAGETGPESEQDKKLDKERNRLDVNNQLYNAMVWGRLYGGALNILGIDDGQEDWSQPVDEDRIRSINYINTVDRRFISAIHYYADYQKPNYGWPSIYRVFRQISDVNDPQAKSFFDIHESRVIRFEGISTDVIERQILAGWSHSVLQPPHEEIKRFMMAFQSAANLVSDASQGVYKLKGLIAQIGTTQGQANLQARMAMVDMARSVARSLILDADGEDFQRIATSFTSIPEMLDRFMQMLSMVTGIPVTILMGRSAAGMNATGDSDFRAFYAEVANQQERMLRPILQRLFRYICLAKNSPTKGKEVELDFTFPALWDPTDKEKAEANFIQAQADEKYIQNEVITPEECAQNRFGHGQFNSNTVVDLAAREDAVKKGMEFDPYPNGTPRSDGAIASGDKMVPETSSLSSGRPKGAEGDPGKIPANR